MQLHELVKTNKRRAKRVGRGPASGKGKTAGRGEKGQKKRGKVKPGFEGGQLPLYQRLPHKRGIGNLRKLKSFSITTSALNKFPAGALIDKRALQKVNLLPKSVKNLRVKIVHKGKLDKKLTVSLPATKKARASIKKAGGKLTNEDVS